MGLHPLHHVRPADEDLIATVSRGAEGCCITVSGKMGSSTTRASTGKNRTDSAVSGGVANSAITVGRAGRFLKKQKVPAASPTPVAATIDPKIIHKTAPATSEGPVGMGSVGTGSCGELDGFVEAFKDGDVDGSVDGFPDGLQEGRSDGVVEGSVDSFSDGHQDGKVDGTVEAFVNGDEDGGVDGSQDGHQDGRVNGVSSMVNELPKTLEPRGGALRRTGVDAVLVVGSKLQVERGQRGRQVRLARGICVIAVGVPRSLVRDAVHEVDDSAALLVQKDLVARVGQGKAARGGSEVRGAASRHVVHQRACR
eukprot:scaffold7068_cov301-Pinguiococcus_pyrenoidosus.AAC.20